MSGQLGADAAYGKKNLDLTTRPPEKPVSVPWERYDAAGHTVLALHATARWKGAIPPFQNPVVSCCGLRAGPLWRLRTRNFGRRYLVFFT